MSFRLKTILGIAFIQGILLIALVAMSLSIFRGTLNSELVKHATTTARVFSTTAQDAIISSDLATLESFSDQVMSNHGIVYVRVLDAQGFVMAERGDAQALSRAFKADVSLDDAASDGVFDTVTLVGTPKHPQGRIEIGLETNQLHQVLQNSRDQAAVIAFAGIVLVALFSFILGRYLTRRILALEEATHKLEAGELGFEVKVGSKDEVGRLAESFNGMSRRLLENRDQIEAQTKYLEGVISNIYDGVIVMDEKGIIRDANPAMTRIFGYSKDELVGNDVAMLLPNGQHKDQHQSYMADAETVKYVLQTRRELVANSKSNGQVHTEITIDRMVDEEGRILYVTIINDATRRKQDEEVLKDALHKAQQANRAKSEFLATMSHEIRTPMNGILGMCDLLGYTPMDETQRNYLGTINSSGQALLSIINDILDYSKMEAGRFDLDIHEYNLDKLVADTVQVLGQQAHDKAIELAYRIAPDVSGMQKGDAGRVRQILTNLIGNAIKFTSQGGVSLSVERDETGFIKFVIRDTGIGISDENVEKLFSRFSQVDSSIARQFGGTGLGLAICKRLVEMMGGQIGVDSELNKGSTFWFLIPDVPGKPVSESEKVDYGDVSELNALIVDDNSVNREVFEGQLSSWGMSVTSCASADEALFLMKANRYEVCIFDVQMPNVSGIELVSRLSLLGYRDDTFIILASSIGKHELGEQLQQIDYDKFLMKPVHQSELFDVIAHSRAPLENKAVELERQPGAEVQATEVCDVRVLIAEDNEINQIVLKGILTKFGLSAQTVNDGQEALDAARTGEFDLIFMDVHMPNMDGLEATRQIRALDGPAGQVAIIGVTANAMKGDDQKCFDAGMDGYVSKPIDRNLLNAEIKRVMGRRNGDAVGDGRLSEENQPSVDVLNRDMLDTLEGELDKDGVAGLLKTHLEKWPNRQMLLLELIATQNFEGLRREVHTLKGTAGTLGLTQVFTLAQAMEEVVRDNQGDEELRSYVSQLDQAVTLAQTEVAQRYGA